MDETEESELFFGMETTKPVADISLSSVVGLTKPKTMKLKGEIEGVEDVLMIDLGAKTNFMSLELGERLNIPYSSFFRFDVTLRNGKKIQGEGKCRQLRVEVQGFSIIEDFLILELGSTNVIIRL
jgi:hypothetical protein